MVIKDINDAVKVTTEALPKTTNAVDSALSTVIDAFGNIILYPIKKANLYFKYKLESFENDLKEKTRNIPPQYFQEPKLSILGPVMEALKYTIDEKELREMYINLLSASMDKRNDDYVHAAYIDVIKKMSPVDAQIFSRFAHQSGYMPITRPSLGLKNSNNIIPNIFPEWFYIIDNIDPFIVSESLVRLSKFGIIELVFDRDIANPSIYNSLINSPILTSILISKFNMIPNNMEIKHRKSAMYVNDFGRRFAKICLPLAQNTSLNKESV